MLPEALKKPLRRLRTRLGLDPAYLRPVRPSLNGLDAKLEAYLNIDGGFFIEAGANDGITQSNTFYFEKYRGWRGILVEGIPDLFEKCVANRTNSRVFNCALVASSFTEPSVTMHYANLMSIVEGARGAAADDAGFIGEGLEIQALPASFSVQVPARTLSSILDECNVVDIDLLSLDVEGYEGKVLGGLDLHRHRPKFICVEAWDRVEIDRILEPFYVRVADLTARDVLYRVR